MLCHLLQHILLTAVSFVNNRVMACSVRQLTRSVHWSGVREFFFPDEILPEESIRDEDFDNRWNWDPDSGNQSAHMSSHPVDNQWLSQCHLSLSPDGKLLAIAKGIRLMTLYDRHGLLEVLTAKTVDVRPGEEIITSLNCIPLASQQKSNEAGIDWTAVLVGFSSGKLRVFTDSGCLLLIQKVHDEPVTGICCTSFYPCSSTGRRIHPQQPDHPDQILLSLRTIAVLIEGFAFYQTIRSARSHLAKLALNQNLNQHVIDMGIQLPVTKWSFRSDPANQIHSMASGGLSASSIFDHLVNLTFADASLQSKTNQSVATPLVTVGESPFVGFYETVTTDSPSLLNGVAQAVVNRAKNLLPLFGSKKDESSTELPTVALREHVGIYDLRRKGLSIVFSPDKKYLVVTDDFGRVVLCDSRECIALRIWKGYREAECAFLEISENNEAVSRKSLCLVIYARKRGVVEVWRCERGPRIASMTVGKNCSLFAISHSTFGLNSSSWMKQRPHFDRCYILDRDEGTLSAVEVPFASTLTDGNSAAARDTYLLKEATHVSDPKRVAVIFEQLKTLSARKEALKLSFKSPELAHKIATSFMEQHCKELNVSEEGDGPNFETKAIFQSCSRVVQLCELYNKLSSFDNFQCRGVKFDDVLPQDIESLSDEMGWPASDVAKCLSLFSLYHSVAQQPDHQPSRTLMQFNEFMQCFHMEDTQIHKQSDGEMRRENIPVRIDWTFLKSRPDLTKQISSFMFQLLADETVDSGLLFSLYDKSCICPEDLIRLLFVSWLSCQFSFRDWHNWIALSFFTRTIASQMSDLQKDGVLPTTWKSVCGFIVSSNNLPAALIAMFTVKAVTDAQIVCKKIDPNESDSNPTEEEWETLHVDFEKLNIALKQMEDTFLLDLFLRTNDKFHTDSMSLESLISSSPAIVSELVARWIVNGGRDICGDLQSHCTSLSDVESSLEEDASEAILRPLNAESAGETSSELLQHVYRCFPHSLNPQVIVSNCCWEHASRWHKNPSASADDLKMCISYLNRLKSPFLEHNIACLLWKTFVVKSLETLTNLTEKMSKIPKDRICKRDLNMSEDCIEPFVCFANDLLEVIVENVKLADQEVPPVFHVDEWWRNRSHKHALPLIFVACSVKNSNWALVLAHLHLVQILMFTSVFQMKGVKPLSLFMPGVRQYLFNDLHSQSFEAPPNDFQLNDWRLQFLEKVIVCIAQSTPVPDPDSGELMITPSRAFKESNEWFNKVLTLSREWELSTDILRRKYIRQLYAGACDVLAREIQNSCREKGLLSLDLLPIACRRVDMLVNLDQSALDDHALQWMQATDTDLKVVPASKESTELLLDFLMSNLPESNLKIASSLLETLHVKSSE